MTAPLTLAIETSGPQSSLALADAERVLLSRDLSADRAYSSELFPAIRALLADAGHSLRGVSLFAFSAGPGSFTGLRIAATVGRMLHSVVGCRVVAVPTLETIAQNAFETDIPAGTRIVALLDAKRGQAYSAVFECGKPSVLRSVETPAVRTLAAWLPTLAGPIAITGPGVAANRVACEPACAGGGAMILPETLWRPRAETVALLGQRRAAAGLFCRPEEIVPLYARPPECEEVYEQRRADARARRGE